MTSREDMLKKLHADDLFSGSLGMVRDADERKMIVSMVEGFVCAFADALDVIVAQAEIDATENDTEHSGSKVIHG